MGSAIAIATLVAPAQAASLTAWNFDPNTNHLEVTVKDGTTPRYFLMAQPARIVMDLPGTSIAGVRTQASYGGAVRQIRVSQFQPNLTRIVLELAPGVMLAAGQVNLEKGGDASRWVLRPLLAPSSAAPSSAAPSSAAPSSAAPAAPSSATVNPSSPAPVSLAPRSPIAFADSPPSPQSTPIAVPPPLAQVAVVPTPATIVTAALPQDSLPQDSPPPNSLPQNLVTVPPPVSDRLLQPPVAGPEAPQNLVTTPAPIGSGLLPPTVTRTEAPPAAIVPPALAAAPLFPSAAAPASLEIPTTLAIVAPTPIIAVPSFQALKPSPAAPAGSSIDLSPTTAQSLQSPAPQLVSPTQVAVPPLQSPAAIGAIDLPQSQPSSVSVPPLQPQESPAIAPVPAPPQPGVIEFGQPIAGAATGQLSLGRNGTVLAGALLSLRYPGTASLKLRTGTPHQEVLLLQSELRDGAGNLIAPKDSMVIGRFETSKAGSRFIAQAISLQGRSVPLVAQSEILAGTMAVSDRNLAVNSGIGAIAGGIIGGFSGAGLAGGAATGAAVTLLTSPKPATVQPGQIVQIRLLQDLQ